MSSTGSSASNGLMQRVSDLSWNAVKSDGTIANAILGTNTHAKDLQTSIDAMTATLQQRADTLKAQFTAMETALSNLKAMQAQMAAQLPQTTATL
jgi:flagellar capping protein FliD